MRRKALQNAGRKDELRGADLPLLLFLFRLQGPLVILKDYSRIADGSVVGAGTIIPSLTEWSGSPGTLLPFSYSPDDHR